MDDSDDSDDSEASEIPEAPSALADPDEGTELDETSETDDVAGAPVAETTAAETTVAETTAAEPTAETATTPVLHEPLITDEAEQGFLSRWAEIQVGFVEDPAQSVRDADALIQEIADALQSTLATRRAALAADWQHGSPDTEQLRLALRRYRSFLGVVLPK